MNKGAVPAYSGPLSPLDLRKLVSYDQATGNLIWNPRTPDQFRHGRHGMEATALMWNTKNAGKIAFNSDHDGAGLRGRVFGSNIMASHAVWCWHTGEWPEEPIIHKDDDYRNNRIENLAACDKVSIYWGDTIPENNTSGVRGVSWHKHRQAWQARIMVHRRSISLGYFGSIMEAEVARKVAEKTYHHKTPVDGVVT